MASTTHTRHSRWDALREKQRTAVVEAILALITEGTSAISVAEVADAAGMSRPTFYKYFPTFGAAMLHTHRVALGRMSEYVATGMPEDGTSLERLLATMSLRFEFTSQRPELTRFFSYFDFTFRRFGLTDDEHRELDTINAQADTTYQLFITGQQDGSIRADLDLQPTLMALAGSVVGLTQRLLIQDEYSTGVDDKARAAHALLLDSWRTTLTPTNR